VLADPVLVDPVLVAPAPADSAPTDLLALDPVSLDPALTDPALTDPALTDPALTDPALTDPALTDPVPVAGGVLSVGLLPVPPPAGGLDGGNTVVGELLGVDARGVARGLADLGGWVELVSQRDPVAPAVCLPLFALVLDFAEAVLLVSPVAVEVAFAVRVGVAVTVRVGVAVAVPVGVTVAVPVGVTVAVSPALLLVLPLAGLLTELAGGALGFADLAGFAGLAGADDGETVEHGVTGALLWTAEVPPPPAPPTGAFWVADPFPFRLGVPSELELEIPTAEPRLTKASRSGGTARATPMANTAQAAAIAGRSHPYRQSRCCRSPGPSASWPPRAAFHRRTMPARKPARAAACLLA
jgi:hypothetical protein